MATKRAASPATGNFVVKEEHDDGSITWVDTVTAEEIRLHRDTPPTAATLKALAANGIVPKRPTIDDVALSEPDMDDHPEYMDDHPEFVEEVEETPFSRVLARLGAAGADNIRAEVKVYRVKDNGAEVYCGVFQVEEFDKQGEELIRSAWGAGKYRVRLYGPSMKPGSNYGKFVRLTNELVEIEESMIPLKPVVGLPGGSEGSVIAQVLGVVEKLASKVQQIEQKKEDPWEFMFKLKELGLMGGAQRSNPMQDLAYLEKVMGLRRMIKEEAVEDGEGGDNKPDSLLALGSKALEIIGPALQKQATAQPDPTMPVPQIPASFQQPETESEVNPAQQIILNMAVVGIIAGAARNDPIEKHAPGIADMIPDELVGILENPSWFEMLCEAVPKHQDGLQQHREWVTRLRDEVLRLLFDDEGQDQTGPVVNPKQSG